MDLSLVRSGTRSAQTRRWLVLGTTKAISHGPPSEVIVLHPQTRLGSLSACAHAAQKGGPHMWPHGLNLTTTMAGYQPALCGFQSAAAARGGATGRGWELNWMRR